MIKFANFLIILILMDFVFNLPASSSQENTNMLPVNFESFQYPVPTSMEEWEEIKPVLRAKLRRLLGNLPRMFTPEPEITPLEENEIYTLSKIEFDNGAGHTVYGYLVIPAGRTEPGPAILYHHYHGGEYDNGKEEILKNYPVDTSPAEVFAKAGYVVLAIDAYAFGERQHQGPAEEEESGNRTEAALFKTFVWEGKTLWGMMVRDDILALNYLLSRPEVDPERVGATGMSMGSTRTWWLAALDERIKASVCVCCLTRYQNLIQQGDVNEHGIYYFVPDILYEGIDMEAVVGLIAPRPLLTQTGDQDAGSPVDGVKMINQFTEEIYDLYDQSDNFEGIIYEGVGHNYISDMWRKTLSWFNTHLK